MADGIRWGILSTAKIARAHVIPAIRESSNGTVAAIASRKAERAREVAADFDIPRACASYAELLADPGVDAVYLPLPVSLHCEWALRCAAAGKPLLCEKPLAANSSEARRMIDAFANAGLPLAEGFMYRFHPLTEKVRSLLAEGVVGRPNLLQATFHVRVEDPANIRLRRETAGSGLRDVGAYCVGVMRHLLGEEPVEVTARARFNAEGVDTSLVGTLAFPSGALGCISCGLETAFACHYEISGPEGRLHIPQGTVPGTGEAVIELHRNHRCEEIRLPGTNHYRLMVEDFAAALLEGRPPRFPAEEAIGNLEVIDRLLAAAADEAGPGRLAGEV